MSAPTKVFQIGRIRASIFMNEVRDRDGKVLHLPKVKIEVRYRDKRDGRWKGTSSMTLTEIPKAILALQKAYDYLMS